MPYRSNDGYLFTADDPKAVIRQMRDLQWNAPQFKRDYIKTVRERVWDIFGVRPRRRADLFLADLVQIGLLTYEPSVPSTDSEGGPPAVLPHTSPATGA